jgi:ketosteroid isomerase-like protein
MVFATADEAEAAFYAAFQRRDLAAMMAVWAMDDNVACIHPMTVPLTGQRAVEVGWQSIFDAAGKFAIQTETLSLQQVGDVVIHCVKEYLTIGDETTPRPPILATNVYRRAADGWRMWLHHGSPVQAGESRPTVVH